MTEYVLHEEPCPAPLQPAEAVYGFAAWLTLLGTPLTVGATCDAAPVADLVHAFCLTHGLGDVRAGFETRLQYPQDIPFWRAGDDL